MTVVLALCCSDGVVMASDSQATEGAGVDTRHPVQKVFELTPCAVWGGSGSGWVIEELGHKFASESKALEKSADIRKYLAGLMRPVLDSAYKGYVPVPQLPPAPPVTSVLAAGYTTDGGPWIVEIDHHCNASNYGSVGHHSIGSGAGFALMSNALMSHFDVGHHPVERGTRVAYRALNAVIQTSAQHVGPPIQVWTVTSAGTHQLSPDEVAELDEFVASWQQLEVETLDQAMAEVSGAVFVDPAPMPDSVQDA